MTDASVWWENESLLDAADAAELAGYRARLGEVVELAESALREAEARAEALRGSPAGAEPATQAAEVQVQAARAALAQARAWFEDAEAAGPPSALRVLAGLRRGLAGVELVDFMVMGRGRPTAVAAAGSEVDRG